MLWQKKMDHLLFSPHMGRERKREGITVLKVESGMTDKSF